MAKVVGPLFSIAASGQIASTLTYRCGQYCAVSKRLPKDRYAYKGPVGEYMQEIWELAPAKWHLTTEEQKKIFTEYANSIPIDAECSTHKSMMSGYNIFIALMSVTLVGLFPIPMTELLVTGAYLTVIAWLMDWRE